MLLLLNCIFKILFFGSEIFWGSRSNTLHIFVGTEGGLQDAFAMSFLCKRGMFIRVCLPRIWQKMCWITAGKIMQNKLFFTRLMHCIIIIIWLLQYDLRICKEQVLKIGLFKILEDTVSSAQPFRTVACNICLKNKRGEIKNYKSPNELCIVGGQQTVHRKINCYMGTLQTFVYLIHVNHYHWSHTAVIRNCQCFINTRKGAFQSTLSVHHECEAKLEKDYKMKCPPFTLWSLFSVSYTAF